MDAGINNVIYMELSSGPKMANGRCGKTIDTGTIDRGSTVYIYILTLEDSTDRLSQNVGKKLPLCCVICQKSTDLEYLEI